MGALRNLRHEKFAREYVKTGYGSHAYCRAYNRRQRDLTARVNASKLLTHTNVRQRIAEVRDSMIKRSDITIEKILTDYQNAMDREDAKPSDVIQAATAQAKLLGMIRDKVETGQPGEFDNPSDYADLLEQLAQKLGPEKALQFAQMLGITIDTDELINADTPSEAIN